MRVAGYSGVKLRDLLAIRPVLHDAARRFRAELIPVPIASGENAASDSDSDAIRFLLAGFDDASDGGAQLKSPEAAIGQVARCRIMITGSYHAAVFALAQGIPAICLAKSAYYRDKFLGLADQFGDGCEVISQDVDDWPSKLAASIDKLWKCSDTLNERLIQAAAKQVDAGRAAYQRLFEIAKCCEES